VFTNIEEIKLRLIENVFSDKLTNALVIEDETLKFEGIDLGGYINYKDIPEFANHEELKELRKKYEAIQEKYITLSSKENCEFLELEKTYAQKEILRGKIKELEQKILKLSINLVEMINQRMDSETISKAMQLFSEGKVKECIELLKLTPTSDLIKKAYELKSKSEEDKEKAIGNAVWAIKENKIIIDLLHISDDYENKQELIDNLYEQTATWAIQFEVMLDEVFDYIKYCIKQNYLDKAYKYLEQIEFLITDKSERKYPLLYAKLYNIKAFVSSMNDDYEETIELYRTSIDYFQNSKNLELEHEEYLYGLFNSYFEVGCLVQTSRNEVAF
jgi:hypothetical protein